MKSMSFRFVDLFSGIGGFHAALSGMGGRCVHAVENNAAAAAIYDLNWGHNPFGDITLQANDEVMDVPPHDLLVAGFPCQPFSKSGAQLGMEETRGTLYWNILQIIEQRRPAMVLLENVRNLAGPRHLHEWQVIIETLAAQSYRVSEVPTVLSPHRLHPALGGRPQVRERVFIVAVRTNETDPSKLIEKSPFIVDSATNDWDPFDWKLDKHLPLDRKLKDPSLALTPTEIYWIDAWNEFVKAMLLLRNGIRLPGFPLWADAWILPRNLKIPKGTPSWKQDFLRKNAEFYAAHQSFIDKWTKEWGVYTDLFPASRRKLEWQAQDTASLWDTVMHFRPSGIRAKRPTYLPALVAITQTSIIGPLRRRISTQEAARLQGLPDWFSFGEQKASQTYRQLGNGVNIGAVWYVLRQAAIRYEKDLKKTSPKLLRAITSSPQNPDEALAKLGELRPISQVDNGL
jgi:DNA (cytosine-5)-methyltransferase 1